jgi:hypothetical protein|nr:MAG TPA: hypothetical protein [Caudoviricetes sp.]
MGRTVAARWVEHWMETPEKKDWFGRVTQDICNGCARQGTCECPDDIRCFYTLDKPFYRPKA